MFADSVEWGDPGKGRMNAATTNLENRHPSQVTAAGFCMRIPTCAQIA